MPWFFVGKLFVVVILESGDDVLGWFSSSSSTTTFLYVHIYSNEWSREREKEPTTTLLLGVITQPWEGFTILLPSIRRRLPSPHWSPHKLSTISFFSSVSVFTRPFPSSYFTLCIRETIPVGRNRVI
jgi:hypothetical protein